MLLLFEYSLIKKIKMTEIKPINKNLLKNLELDLASNKEITSDNSSIINKESNNIKGNKQINIVQNNLDIFGDITSIIKNKIKIKISSKNNNYTKRNKTERKNKSPFKNFTETKNHEKFLYNLNNNINNINIININTFSATTKDNSQISLNSNKIKTKKRINPELFINKRNKNNENKVVKSLSLESQKKINLNAMLNRFEEERKKASEKFEIKKQEMKEKEEKIYTGKPLVSKTKLTNYEKYSKDFLIRQKELYDDLIKKKKKLIEENNKKKEEEYKLITSQNILLNKNKKKYHRNKSSDHWVDRLYKQDTQKRKMERYCLDTAFVPSFKPNIEKKNVKNILDKNKTQLNKVLKEYEENTNPELIINYLNTNKNSDYNNQKLFRNKIFGKPWHKFCNKKINNSIE